MRTGFEALRVGKALYIVPVMFGFTGLLSGSWPAMVFAGVGGMLFLLMFPVVTMGFYQGPLGLGGRTAAAAAGLAFMASALAAGTEPALALLAPGSLLMAAGTGILVTLHVRQKARWRSEYGVVRGAPRRSH